eukprot:403370866
MKSQNQTQMIYEQSPLTIQQQFKRYQVESSSSPLISQLKDSQNPELQKFNYSDSKVNLKPFMPQQSVTSQQKFKDISFQLAKQKQLKLQILEAQQQTTQIYENSQISQKPTDLMSSIKSYQKSQEKRNKLSLIEFEYKKLEQKVTINKLKIQDSRHKQEQLYILVFWLIVINIGLLYFSYFRGREFANIQRYWGNRHQQDIGFKIKGWEEIDFKREYDWDNLKEFIGHQQHGYQNIHKDKLHLDFQDLNDQQQQQQYHGGSNLDEIIRHAIGQDDQSKKKSSWQRETQRYLKYTDQDFEIYKKIKNDLNEAIKNRMNLKNSQN